MLARLAPSTFAFAAISFLADARADVITDEEAVCRDKQAGDACTAAGKAGVCETRKCGRLDYSKGTPPTPTEVDCLWCVPKATAEATPVPQPTPAKTDEKGTDPPAKASVDAKPVSAPASEGCAVVPIGGATSLVSLLLGVGLLLASRRRAR